MSTHGGIGENEEKLQGLLDIFSIKYTGNGCQSNAISLDKKKSYRNDLWVHLGLKVPGEYKEKSEFVFPLVIKPNDSGSSIGVQIIKTRGTSTIRHRELYFLKNTYMEESFLLELLGKKILQPIEIIIEDGFYDYQKKNILQELLRKFCPADISDRAK